MQICTSASVDMHAIKLIFFTFLSVVTVTGQNPVCYDGIGCFPTGDPWNTLFRPVPSPQGPDIVKVFFLLYTSKNPTDPFYAIGDTEWSVEGSYFDGQQQTMVFIHGWNSSTDAPWMNSTKNAMLKSLNGNGNVILVDYGSIKDQDYIKATANIRMVGAMVSKFLNYLIQDKGASPSRLHIVGFSLGAHVAGYVGKKILGIERITGLDPAQPLFEGQSVEVRLDKNDALFVDIAHSNGSPTIPLVGFGFTSPIGDVDFYFNGGWDQPGCTVDLFGQLANGSLALTNALPKRLSCPHLRAVLYFTEALANPNCTFWGIQRQTLNAILRIASSGWLSEYLTQLSKCTIETCIPFGLRTPEFPGRGSFDVSTALDSPFCIYDEKTNDRMERMLIKYKSTN